jgi:uncharacterized membrane protein
MSSQWLVFLHLVGALLFVGGSLVAAVLRAAAMRRSHPDEIALLLRAVRPAVPIVAGGLVLTIAAGIALTDRLDIDFGATWLSLTFALLAFLVIAGAAAGRYDRHTRELAEELAASGDRLPSDLLHSRLRNPVNLLLNGAMLVATLAIVALMVWKP